MTSLLKKHVAIFLMYPSLATSAQPPVPAEFAELYQVVERTVKFKDLSGNYHNITMLAGYDNIKINSDGMVSSLQAILISNNVKKDVINNIISELSVGIQNGNECTGRLGNCVVQPDTYAFLYDFYSNVVYFYINPKLLIEDNNLDDARVVYADPVKSDWGVINHINSYVSKSNNSDANFSFYNESTVGLAYGNFDTNFYYQSGSDDFELDKFVYNYEFDKYRLIVGLSRDQLDINSTDFLTSGTLNKETSVTFATSNNMVVGKKATTQKMFYFAPNDGVLTVYRGDRIIYQKNVPAGQGYISNTDLPKGRYDVKFELKVSGQVISQEVKTVYNSSGDTLAIKASDFAISAGIFNKTFERFNVSDDDFSFSDIADIEQPTIRQNEQESLRGEGFLKGLYTYRPVESVVLGVGGIVAKAERATNVGIKTQLSSHIEATISGQFFSDGASYFDSYINFDDWSISYQKFNLDSVSQFHYQDNFFDEGSSLARYYYGNTGYTQFYLSKGFRVSRDVQAYLNYSYYTNEHSDAFNDGYTSSMLSTGVTLFTFGSSTLQFNANYDFNGGDSYHDKFSTQLVFSIPLSGKLTAESRLVTGKGRISSFGNSLQSGNLLSEYDGVYGAMRVGNNYYPQGPQYSTFDTSANVSLNKDKYIASAYGYLNDVGDYSGSANFSSSQLMTENGISLTSNKANSYLVVDSDSKLKGDERSDSVKGLLIIESDDKGVSKKLLRENVEVIPLKDYQSYRAILDTESVDLNNTGDTSAEVFTMPGTVTQIKSNVTRVLSFVSGFKDLYNNSISDIHCEGDGCLGEDQIVEGIYKFSVKEGVPFKLTNNDVVCFIPKVEKAKLFNFGDNYCLPEMEPTEQAIIYDGYKNMNITFVGGFSLKQYNSLLKQYIEQLNISKDSIIDRVVGDNVYIYVSTDSQLTAKQQEVIGDMEQYVLTNGFYQEQHMYILAKI